MEQGEFHHERHTALLLIGHILSTGAAKPNAEYTICEAATKAMRIALHKPYTMEQ